MTWFCNDKRDGKNTMTRDPRYSFMFGHMTISDNMAEVVGRIFRIPVNDKPITDIDLSELAGK